MEQYGIIINDRSNDSLTCELFDEDQIVDAIAQAQKFYKAMNISLEILVGPINQLIGILEANGIQLDSFEKTSLSHPRNLEN